MVSGTLNTLMKLNASHIGNIHMLDIQCSYFLPNTHVISARGTHKMILCARKGTMIQASWSQESWGFVLSFSCPRNANIWSKSGLILISGGLTRLTLFFKLPGFDSLFLLFIVVEAFPDLNAFIPQTLQVKHKTVIYHPHFYMTWNRDKDDQSHALHQERA